jgi:hypothetical protein
MASTNRFINGLDPAKTYTLGEWELEETTDGMLDIRYQDNQQFRVISQPNVTCIARFSDWSIRKDPGFNFSVIVT